MTGGSTNLQYEDVATDSHNAWSGSVFTAPDDGVYSIDATLYHSAGSIDGFMYINRNGVSVRRGMRVGDVINRAAAISSSLRLSAGDVVVVRYSGSVTRSTAVLDNTLSICRIGD